tara:strand:+ start:17637 stop:18056 length:420 start_codon:yes stop_codon:yes gene_type:complete
MRILTTSTDAQIIKFIPRLYYTEAAMIVRDDTTNIATVTDVTFTQSGDYLQLSHSFNLVEGRFYDLEFTRDPDVWGQTLTQYQLEQKLWNDETGITLLVYRDRIFCTNQDVDQTENKYYSPNKNEYKSNNTFDNNYIVL